MTCSRFRWMCWRKRLRGLTPPQPMNLSTRIITLEALVWDDEIQRHLHCYYRRSDAGNEHDRDAYQRRLPGTMTGALPGNGRQFPSKRLMQKLAWLREEQAKARQTLAAWDRLIIQVEEQIALDEIVHTGTVRSAGF